VSAVQQARTVLRRHGNGPWTIQRVWVPK
jgi:hypothetical protein